MSTIEATLRRAPNLALRGVRAVFVGAGLVLVGALFALAAYRNPPSLPLVAVGGIGLLALLALALARYDSAVALGMLLICFVKIEPAPTDAVFMVVIAVGLVTGRFRAARVPMIATSIVGIFLALNLLSMFDAVDMARAIRFSIITFFLAVFGLWLASWVDSTERARIVLRFYVAAAVFSAAIGSAALFLPIPARSSLSAYNFTRAEALFQDPNVFGAFLVPAALFLIGEILAPTLLASRRLTKIVMLLVVCLGVLLSFSRAAWATLLVGVVVMLVVLALRRGGVRHAVMLVGVAVTAGAIVMVVLAATGSVGFLQQRAHFQSYDTARFGAQERGLKLVSQHPFGIGPGQFELAANLSAHSTYVRSLTELGILGIATVLALMIATLVLASRNAVLGRDTYGVGTAPLLGAWVGLLISGFVIDTLHWRHLWVVAALIWAGSMRSERPEPD